MSDAARLRNLKASADAGLDEVFQKFAEELGPGSRAVIQLRVAGEDERAESRTWLVTPGEGGSQVAAGAAGRPHLELIASEETFDRMASGEYSPVDAFRDGKMRLRGDDALAKQILEDLKAPSD